MEHIFEKRSGTTDRGKHYEHLYITHLILKLTNDDTIEDFWLSSNDKKFGSFDDVVITIKHTNKPKPDLYAIQLKQSAHKVLRTKDLTGPKGSFSLNEYLQDYRKNLKPCHESAKMILFTNCKAQIGEGEIKFEVLSVPQNNLFATNRQGLCFMFRGDNKSEDFFEKFFLYCNQADVDQIERLNLRMFVDLFQGDETVFTEFVAFIVKWSMKEGNKEKLNKTWMRQIVTLYVLSPSVKTLVFDKGVVTDKEKTLRGAISRFHVTVLGRESIEIAKFFWRDVLEELGDLAEVNKIRSKYQIRLKFIETVEDLMIGGKETSKLLWLLGKSPLIVKQHPQSVKVLRLTKNMPFVVQCEAPSKYPGFLTLADLKPHKDIFSKVINTFTYSLEGQKAAPLKNLIVWGDQFETIITTNHLVQMTKGPLLFGNHKETLPPCHLPRTILKILIDPRFLNEYENSLILISSVKDYKVYQSKMGGLRVIDADSGTKIQSNVPQPNRNLIFLSKQEYSFEEYTKLCEINPGKAQTHHFRYLNEDSLEWVRSSNVGQLHKFRLNQEYSTEPIEESQLLGKNENCVNIICANSGMGKTTLMKSLKSGSCSSTWTIFIQVRNRNVEKFLEGLLEDEVFRVLMRSNQVRLLWDGLNEVSSRYLEEVLALVCQFSRRGIKQWLTARDNLKSLLENRFGTFSRTIQQFSRDEQRIYIQERSTCSQDELLKKISNDVLGIPLQIYMLTELFKNGDKYSQLLNDSFTILDLYESFVEEKFRLYYCDKIKYDLSIEMMYQKYQDEKSETIECYKKLAFNFYLRNHRFSSSGCFLEKIKAGGDSVGFISNVTDDNLPEFVHNSFGEYFAALYLYEHEPSRSKEPRFITIETNNNIRFFLDLLLCRKSKAHLAVLLKNSLLLDECTEEELNRKDSINRSILELSFSWIPHNNLTKPQKIGYGRFNIHTKYSNHYQSKTVQFGDIAKSFEHLQSGLDIRVKKLLLLLPFLIPLYTQKSCPDDECAALILYYSVRFDYVVIFKYILSVDWLGRAYENFEYLLSVAFLYEARKCLQEFVLKKQYRDTLRQNLNILLDSCKVEIDEIFSALVRSIIDVNELICFTFWECRFENIHFLSKSVKVDVTGGDGRTLMHYACDNELDGLLIVDFLIKQEKEVNVLDSKRRLPLHYACMNRKYGPRIVSLLIDRTTNLDSPDLFGRSPLHYACDNEEHGFEIAELLVRKGANLDSVDVEKRTPLHYACMNWNQGYKLVRLLIDGGTNPSIPDKNGRTPLHHACNNYYCGFDIVNLLIDTGVPLDTLDFDHKTPVEYLCESGQAEAAALLIEKTPTFQHPNLLFCACRNYFNGFKILALLLPKTLDINIKDHNNQILLHHACQNSKPETVKLLLDYGAQTDSFDFKNRLPLHYACMNSYHSSELVKLLIQTTSRIGVPDVNGRLPIHYACENGDAYTVRLLLDRSILQMYIPDLSQATPLHYSCVNFNNGVDIVRLLVEKGANVDDEDDSGRTPLHYACETGSVYTVQVLLALGAKVDVVDASGRKPVEYARAGKNYAVVKLLGSE